MIDLQKRTGDLVAIFADRDGKRLDRPAIRFPLAPSAIRLPTVWSMFRQYSIVRASTGLGHSVQEVADDVGDQPVALGVVHDLAHQGAGLTEVIVVLSLRVSGMDELSAEVGVRRHYTRRRAAGQRVGERGSITGIACSSAPPAATT